MVLVENLCLIYEVFGCFNKHFDIPVPLKATEKKELFTKRLQHNKKIQFTFQRKIDFSFVVDTESNLIMFI